MSFRTDFPQDLKSTGLTDQEVLERLEAGQDNNTYLQTSRSYRQILSENLFTFVNGVFFLISFVMIKLDRISDGILVVIVIFGGVLVNIYQEIWAKKKLDEIALLTRPTATVLREGREISIDPQKIVLDDILTLHAGDQILVDGQLVGEGRIEVDESLLTGESDLILKKSGDLIYSGTFCVSGSAHYQAQKVGIETVAYRLISSARQFRRVLTTLQKEINLLIRIFILLACFLWILVAISFLSLNLSLNDVVQKAAVVAGLVPAGLLLAITLSYGLGAVRMLGKDVLIQQSNAVESLSDINILCLDKTGTLTANAIQLDSLYPLTIPQESLANLLGDFASSTKNPNKTSEAIHHAYQAQQREVLAEVAFSSARKWSALSFLNDCNSYYLGAPEILGKSLNLESQVSNWIEESSQQGLRVLLFAKSQQIINENPDTLPDNLEPLGLIRFSDQLRLQVKETLAGFRQAGIEIKVISGDNPSTVAAIAKQAGLGHDLKVISGSKLNDLDESQFHQAAQNHTIFGRITPEQKARLIAALRTNGKHVAMIGDGVNDVPSLKQADLAISMESGSKATRSVADIVLLKDSFASLPHAFLEGQRIRNAILDVMKLFLVRIVCITLLIFSTALVTDSFPLENKQSAIVTLIGIGFPTMFIPIWAKPGAMPNKHLIPATLNFVLPSSLTLTIVSVIVYLIFLVVAILNLPPTDNLSSFDQSIPRSALVCILIVGELLLIPFLKPPTTAWVAGEPLSGDWRYTIMALIFLVVYFLIVSIGPARDFFELSQLNSVSYFFIFLVGLEWAWILRAIWRSRFFDNFLGIDLAKSVWK
jgi:cation-transporting ATPase E